jgi:GTP-binding protein
MFVDEVTVKVCGGRGGDGCVAFLRERFRPHGGPAGGDGGNGGSVVFEARLDVNTLYDLTKRRIIKAENGRPGEGKNCSGKKGRDVVVRVPVGTVIRLHGSKSVMADLTEELQRFSAAAGGRGGRGNQHFATATNQSPRHAESGERGEERELDIELKLIADVGLVGAPNAGKSTLLRRISSARPKVGSYPFTTTEPVLGIVDSGDYTQLVFADIPGLIEGAHRGIGLGDEFLRHIERTAFLLQMVDLVPPDGSDPAAQLRMLRSELKAYSSELAERPSLVVGNKLDLDGAREALDRLRRDTGEEVVGISAQKGEGVPQLIGRLFGMLRDREARSVIKGARA